MCITGPTQTAECIFEVILEPPHTKSLCEGAAEVAAGLFVRLIMTVKDVDLD